MDDPLFQHCIAKAIKDLPRQFQDHLKDVLIVVEDYARGRPLLGLYEGVPLTAWGRDSANGKPPDKITLFKDAIEQYAGSPEEVPRVIQETLFHEIGHYFGLDHEKIGKMERRWRQKRR